MKNYTTFLIVICLFIGLSGILHAQDPNTEFNFSELEGNEETQQNTEETERPIDTPDEEPTPDPISGDGETDFLVQLDWANTTNIRKNDALIRWSSHEVGTFSVTIGQNSSIAPPTGFGEPSNSTSPEIVVPVYTAFVTGNEINLPLSSLDLKTGVEYYVEIRLNPFYTSKKAIFKIVSDDFYDKIIQAVKKDERYETNTDLNKKLMKVIGLQMNDMNCDAHKLLQTYMESAEDDMALRNFRDKFRKRVGIK